MKQRNKNNRILFQMMWLDNNAMAKALMDLMKMKKMIKKMHSTTRKFNKMKKNKNINKKLTKKI